MQINVNFTAQEKRILDARFKKNGWDLEQEVEDHLRFHHLQHENSLMQDNGLTIETLEAVATMKDNDRKAKVEAKAKAEAERLASKAKDGQAD